MPSKQLTLSIVIPVYNEELYIRECLDSIAKQTERPDEVILVDNNSTDRSIEIAKRYKFVKIIKETRQSQVYAQKTGFDKARSEIIGRIDGDTILPPDWVAKVKLFFADNPDTIAITGAAMPRDIYFKRTGKYIQKFYHTMAGLVAGHRLMWGANCALRRRGWSKISDKVLQRPDVWEDFDISFLLARHGKIRFLPNIDVSLSFRAVHKSFRTQYEYQTRSVRTFYFRTNKLRTFLHALIWQTQVVFIYPLTVLDHHIITPLFGKKSPTGRG